MNLISDQNKGLVGVEGGGEQLIMRVTCTQPGTDLEVTLCACAQTVPPRNEARWEYDRSRVYLVWTADLSIILRSTLFLSIHTFLC